MMRLITVELHGRGPYVQSRFFSYEVPKLPRETPDQYEERTWRFKMHTVSDEDLRVCVPADALKKALEAAASRLSERVPGKNRQTFTGRFRSDVRCDGEVRSGEGVLLHWREGGQVLRDDPRIVDRHLHVSARGQKGVGARVFRIFPFVHDWMVTPSFMISDPAITDEVFLQHLQQAGLSTGIGSFRLENGGRCGAFIVNVASFKSKELDSLDDVA